MFKIMKGIYKIDKNKLFEVNTDCTRGHCLKVRRKHCRLNLRKNFFTQRIINDWNRLPASAVNQETILNLKKEIDPLFLHGGLYTIQ